MNDLYELLTVTCIGLGLAAACGFRVFVPLLAMGIAARADYLQLAQGFEWIESTPALVALGVATALEIAAYYLPWVDNLLDSVATPAAFIAGTIATSSVVGGQMHPLLQWSLAVIAGGGAALTTQAVTVATRAASTLTTGGVGNPVVSTAEAAAATAVSVLAIAVPVFAVLFVLLVGAWLVRHWSRRRAGAVVVVEPTDNGMPGNGMAAT